MLTTSVCAVHGMADLAGHTPQVVDAFGFIGVWPDGSDDSPSGTRGWNCLGSSAGEGEYGPTCNPDRRSFGEYEW